MALCLASGCVTAHRGEQRSIADNALAVSCSENDYYHTKLNTAVTCNFQNLSSKWQEVKVSTIHFTEGTRQLSAKESQGFVKAFTAKKLGSSENESVVLGTIYLAGLVAAMSGHAAVSYAGLGTAGAAAGTAVGREVYERHMAAQYGAPEYGDEHILGSSMDIPVGLYVRRSFLVQLQDENQKDNQLELCFEKPTSECIQLAMEWKQDHYVHPDEDSPQRKTKNKSLNFGD